MYPEQGVWIVPKYKINIIGLLKKHFKLISYLYEKTSLHPGLHNVWNIHSMYVVYLGKTKGYDI